MREINIVIGIMMLKDCRATVVSNLSIENDGIGCYIRDRSYGEMKHNKVYLIIFVVYLDRLKKIKLILSLKKTRR